jgi:hypothetical protein
VHFYVPDKRPADYKAQDKGYDGEKGGNNSYVVTSNNDRCSSGTNATMIITSRRIAPAVILDHCSLFDIERYSSSWWHGERNTASNGYTLLAQWIGENLRVENAVIDGEIACVDDSGRSLFNDLLFRRRQCLFFAFDLLYLNSEDLRDLPLVERKARLRRLLRRKRSRILYVDHIETHGKRLIEKVCNFDLAGIVAKRKTSLYGATHDERA